MTVTLVAALSIAVAGNVSPAHADEWRDKQWHLDFLRAAELHKVTRGEGVTVAVVDSGVDGNHPDLKGNVLKGTDTAGGDGWRDDRGHGTAMASLIAGHGHGPGRRDGVLGLAPQAKILPIKEGDLAEGVPLELIKTAGVVNLSIRGGLSLVAKDAMAADIVVVAGAGNTTQDHTEVRQPANYPGVIAVSGVDEDGNFAKESVQGPEVVLAAPAVNIAAAGAGKRGKYNVGTGTSDATALVSATAALIRAKYPDLSANGVINRLIKTADDKGPPGRDPKYGFGVVNPLKALTADIPDIDHNPLIKSSAHPTHTDAPAVNDGGSRSWLLPTIGVLAGMCAVVVVVVAVLLVRRRRLTPSDNRQTERN